MKHLLAFLIVLFSIQTVFSQIEPVKWSAEVEKISDTEYNLIYKADIEDHWHLYSQTLPEGGAIPTEFIYNEDALKKDFKLVGKATESESITKFDKVFQMDLTYFDNAATFTQKIELKDSNISQIEAEISFQACDDARCIFESEIVTFNLQEGKVSQETFDTPNLDAENLDKSRQLDLNITGWNNYKQEEVKEKTNFGIFILGFIGGLIALLTPCVFPMIPLTVSFFTKSAENSQKGIANAILYGFFILLIYVLLSLPFHFLDSLDPEILNTISTNVWLNIIFFLILGFFAFSFFGFYEITLPASWGNKMDEKSSSIGGFIGIFFMALTLAIVSFSCTGPILGSLLAGSLTSDGGAMQLTAGMSGFGLALALPFTLFAMFPKWLNALPKSGGWLNSVKVVLGFLELAMAFKFLSNADLVSHWGLLKREIFLAIWVILGIGLFLYLIGKIKFPHDSPLKKLSFLRISTAVLVISFVIYIAPGILKNPTWDLTALSGFPPPMSYSIYERESECPLGLDCYKDLDEGIAAAKEANKPIMLDFTGWACVNCRKMEEQVWSQSKIYKILKEEYIIISLYVDDRKELPKEEQFKYVKPNGNLKNIRTIGDKWATLQTLNFQNNSQPFYVLLNHNMELLNHTTAYTPNADEYFEWLQKGVENFKK
ncbi:MULTISPECIES: protein-disulfide reductase DsbD family protein [Mesoflavibacter]|uniref:Thioredoxin family protein n=1 Tax=Mesoflavibacter profundi TaxID=2708110 RepID=A0ABT4RYS5_9FLAO|nr:MULTISPECIES: cytochrome c biogenesis protein CcdA [Mesoflavibacter]MDA0176788.1 thioredoxin family protein [Mesoflavibacter profundi]QIJ90446.1 Cytochrome c-type biogenesis protein DsbD, protein-disulfide reductase [Mesoflavibacter sp. HG96]QIJ93174.1 Cytochrome c-type biogenesis protein DsbD, protein-disulfide reductase [Mesoflavibacter sp. HG37]